MLSGGITRNHWPDQGIIDSNHYFKISTACQMGIPETAVQRCSAINLFNEILIHFQNKKEMLVTQFF